MNHELIRAQVRHLQEDDVDDALNDLLMQDLFNAPARGPLMEAPEESPDVEIKGMGGGNAIYTGPHGVVVRTKKRDPQTGMYALRYGDKKIWAVDGPETAGWIAYLIALQTPEKAEALAAELRRHGDQFKAFKKVLGVRLNVGPAMHKLDKRFQRLFYRKVKVKTESAHRGARLLREGVAETISMQIKKGMAPLDYMSLGIKNRFSFKADQQFIDVAATGPGLQMDVRGHWKGRVIIRLTPSDTYSVTFGRIRGAKWKVDKTVDHVYADQLGKVIKENVLGNGIRK